MRNDRVLTAAPVGETSMLSWRLVYYYKMADCKKLWERETISRERKDLILFWFRIAWYYYIAVMTIRLTQLALSLGFEEDLFQTYTTFMTEQYTILWCVFVVVSSSRCLGVLADILLNRFHLLYYYHRQQSNQNRFIFSRHICVNFTRPWRKCRVYPLSLRVCVFV